ncbi:NADH-quinone oxidoreductase subunit NuoF [candidate division KSB3 bacterium]|uniref:NADH-quinone oxidoreductase subunit NuoF n=1 Tax=candidate division KSB3 bacterium TaxID=2044937 RepID=A0A9D5Q4J9_9BACT|nr:NADH-quinone oxidoreductase subunit NuoF [candidate division KSB3 bacterium]MBD3323353.1 NADH-quinone oxidoreductase subunit NuoF [candidate division KSB3 bacterium]
MATYRAHVLVSSDAESRLRGSEDLLLCFRDELAKRHLEDEIMVVESGSPGHNIPLPAVSVYPEGVVYQGITPEDVPLIVEEHLYKGRIVDQLRSEAPSLTGQIVRLPKMTKHLQEQQKIVLKNCGAINPELIEEYIAADGYMAVGKALTEMTPAEVLREIKFSELRGRGGAGFPTGRKLEFALGAKSDTKYIVCNADESEPGTFKDRLIIEGDPHTLLEGMILAGYCIGANEGYIYIRGEYVLAYDRLVTAIEQARDMGLLGKNIFDSGFDFDIFVHTGAGAYVCGEETALLNSLEGQRGEPRKRPPFPPTEGLHQQPTIVNNVETLANLPPIILHGADWYKQFGTENSRGTKVYTILGNITNTGLIEVPMGITLREVIEFYGGSMKDGRPFKLAQTGGSSGSIIPKELIDVPMDYGSMLKYGLSMGSGALLICDDRTCVVDLIKVLLNFFQVESCGKCAPCRIGTKQLYDTFTRIAGGIGTLEELERATQLGEQLRTMCFCGLGQTAPMPILTGLQYFRPEIEAHITEQFCESNVCEFELLKQQKKKRQPLQKAAA